MFEQNNKLTPKKFWFLASFYFFITITIKIIFFSNYFINVDSAFYVKWFSDLTLTNRFLPYGENIFSKNLLVDQNSFLHQLTRRYYNNASEVYTLVPTIINFLLMKSLGIGFKTFNLGSIIFSCFIPLACSYYFHRKYELKNPQGIFLILIIYLLFLSNFYFFYWSPLGIHNYSLFSLLISFFVTDFYHKKKNFFNLRLIIFAVLIPCFSHKFNVPLIFLTLFFVIFFRRNYSNNFRNELFLLISLFILVISPLLAGFYFNPKNIAFLSSFFSGSEISIANQQNVFSSLVLFEFEIIKNSLPNLFLNYYYSLNIIGIFLFFISLYKSTNLILKLFLLSNLVIFVFLPISNFSIRVFNYQLLIVFVLLIEFFIRISISNVIKKKISIFLVFLLFVSYSSYKTFLKKEYDINANELINFYYKDNQKLKDSLFSIMKINKIEPSNIIFGSYLAKDLFYSYFYEYQNIKIIDSFPAINGLYENRNNFRYLKSLNINFDKLYTPYYLDISRIEKDTLNNKNKIFTTSLDKFCQIRISRFNDCGDVKEIKLFFDNKHIDEIFYTGYDYSLNLLKIESN
jgi:hypothetical protein